MKQSILLFLSGVVAAGCTTKEVVTPCDGNCHPDTSPSASSASLVVQPITTTEAVPTTNKIQSASNAATTTVYAAGSFTFNANSSWAETPPPTPQITLQLLNRNQELSFNVVNTRLRVSEKEYMQQGISEMKSLGMNTTSDLTIVNGTKFLTLKSESVDQTIMQWVYVDGKAANVLTCSGPRFKSEDFDACQAIVSTVTRDR